MNGEPWRDLLRAAEVEILRFAELGAEKMNAWPATRAQLSERERPRSQQSPCAQTPGWSSRFSVHGAYPPHSTSGIGFGEILRAR